MRTLYERYLPLFEGEGKGGGGAAPGAGAAQSGGAAQPGQQGGGEATPAWATSLGDSVKALHGGITEMLNFAKERAKASTQQQPPAQEEEPEEPEPVDLEQLPRAAFAEHITRQILTQLNDAVVKPIGQQVQSLALSQYRDKLSTDIERSSSAKRNEDFWDWT